MDYIPVVKTKESIKINVAEILYIEQNLRKTKIITLSDTHEKYSKITDYVEYMGKSFLKCHRSMYVNMDNIKAMKDEKIYFNNGTVICLSRDKFIAAKQRFSRYIITGGNFGYYLFFSCNMVGFVV